MFPRVIMHIGVSVDGRIDWGSMDVGLYYELASRWEVDAMLSGSNTMLASEIPEELPEEYREISEEMEARGEERQLLVVVDSRGRLRNWHLLRKQPWWRNALALCSCATPQSYLDYLDEQGIDHIVAGDDHVDLRRALEELRARCGVKVVRVDSGGTLCGALLRAGLVDEVSLIIAPELVGGLTPRSIFVAPDLTSSEGVIPLRLLHVENVKGDFVWLRYDVVK